MQAARPAIKPVTDAYAKAMAKLAFNYYRTIPRMMMRGWKLDQMMTHKWKLTAAQRQCGVKCFYFNPHNKRSAFLGANKKCLMKCVGGKKPKRAYSRSQISREIRRYNSSERRVNRFFKNMGRGFWRRAGPALKRMNRQFQKIDRAFNKAIARSARANNLRNAIKFSYKLNDADAEELKKEVDPEMWEMYMQNLSTKEETIEFEGETETKNTEKLVQ
jgi:hypothetical protein